MEGEAGIHWQIDDQDGYSFVGAFTQIAKNSSYVGCSLAKPSFLLPGAIDQVSRLGKEIQSQGGRGFYCCDVLVDQDEQWHWTDFNPRPGAIYYVHQMVERLTRIHGLLPLRPTTINFLGSMKTLGTYHRSVKLLPELRSFTALQARLGDLLEPKPEGFVVAGNPGVIEYGSVDLTAVVSQDGINNDQLAKELWQQAAQWLQ